MRYFLELSYKGTAYNGWQRQPDAPSVQQTVETALSTLLRTSVGIVGAGRTDTGVHAAYYVAHFDTVSEIEDTARFCYHLNALMPADIAAGTVTRVADGAHARFDALQREYFYRIVPFKDPFRTETAWLYSVPLDVERMNEAAALLMHYEDFTTFSKLHSNNRTSICRIFGAEWAGRGDELVFTIRADRFLRNMVRSIVGTLVDVGRGKLTVESFGDAVESRDRSRASGSAPAQGLFLSDVLYPEEIFRRTRRQ
ncbi:tRNA pseudouridine(38-40) synthase TruA [Gallalistipes aquisgranensis]|uniref:tRNA pseudouridine(38-40) synthase TruA n=1 Tax=Gallalistipes aquisgranensis TaxID=2779358 RepID=UPI001CF81872|nr:tRNA pseudouridine(38-40) synthase TruA [Gallalistipes aquisgranensis]MBE5032980.1 tRNA pseudouridine(38-40) synthase TruA [Gallalistipes aquisgranensis]